MDIAALARRFGRVDHPGIAVGVQDDEQLLQGVCVADRRAGSVISACCRKDSRRYITSHWSKPGNRTNDSQSWENGGASGKRECDRSPHP
jgi:hypothetical protein